LDIEQIWTIENNVATCGCRGNKGRILLGEFFDRNPNQGNSTKENSMTVFCTMTLKDIYSILKLSLFEMNRKRFFAPFVEDEEILEELKNPIQGKVKIVQLEEGRSVTIP
jgi:hypothetical protein